MELTYQPFTQNRVICLETQTEYLPWCKPQKHGQINCAGHPSFYICHKTREHIYKKHSAFCINTLDLQRIKQFGISRILIKYYGEKYNIIFETTTKNIEENQTTTYQDEIQVIIPITQLNILAKEEL